MLQENKLTCVPKLIIIFLEKTRLCPRKYISQKYKLILKTNSLTTGAGKLIIVVKLVFNFIDPVFVLPM